MGKGGKPASELVAAAQALEDEMSEVEVMSRAVRRIRLDSEKNLARAADELQKTLSVPERLAPRIQALALAMSRMQERQQAALEPLASFASMIQQRTQRWSAHMESFGALGRLAAEANAALSAAGADAATLAHAELQLHDIAERARTLFDAARADDFPELAQEADALKQRMVALRKRLTQRSN